MPAIDRSARFQTACPRNCYSTCAMTVDVEEGAIRRIGANPANLATAEGPCLKGLSYVERSRSPERLLTPMLRNAAPHSFKPVSWDVAIDFIADRLDTLRHRHGPQSILYYTGSGTKGLLNAIGANFWRLFGGCTTTYGDLCWPAGLEATRLTLGENKHNAPWDMANSRLIILWGKNASETNIHQMVFVEQAIERGARLVVIDPRRTQTAEHADLLVQPRPGTDGALALALANQLIERGQIDRDFIATNVLGFEAFSDLARAWTPARAAAVTGVPEETIVALAGLIGAVSPMMICGGFGMQRYTNSGQTMRAMIALAAITGNIGRPGAGWMFANLQSHVFSAPKDPIAFYPPEKPDGVVRVSISTARLGRDILAQRDPPIKAAWVERGNPITTNPESPTVLRAFRSLDLLVVADEFMTDTAREADVVLPTKSLFEQTDVISAYWHPYIQLKRKVVGVPCEVKPDSEIFHLLAARLGLVGPRVADLIPPPGEEAVERYLRDRLASAPGITLESLAQGPLLPPGHQEVAFSDFIFPTPSGKIELLSEEARERWRVDPLPSFTQPEESPGGSESLAARYPLQIVTPNTKNRIHSQFNNLRTIATLSPKPILWISPADARARRIRSGDRVRVWNDRGEIRLEADIDHGLLSGCVWVTNGWWASRGVSVNDLSLGRETDIGHGAAFHDNLVQVALEGRRQ